MRGFIDFGNKLTPSFYTEDYYNFSALGNIVCLTLDTLLPMSSTSAFKWQDWYGLVTKWLPENPVEINRLKEHLLSESWFRTEDFIMYIIPNEYSPPWNMIVYKDYDEEKEIEFGDCRIGFIQPPSNKTVKQLLEIGFNEAV